MNVQILQQLAITLHENCGAKRLFVLVGYNAPAKLLLQIVNQNTAYENVFMLGFSEPGKSTRYLSPACLSDHLNMSVYDI